MSMEKIYPKQKESFGTLTLQKRAESEDKIEWTEDRQRVVSHIAYEVESSVQEGSIFVLVPANDHEIDYTKHYDEEVTLINPSCVLSATDVRNGKANYDIFATKIQLGGNK